METYSFIATLPGVPTCSATNSRIIGETVDQPAKQCRTCIVIETSIPNVKKYVLFKFRFYEKLNQHTVEWIIIISQRNDSRTNPFFKKLGIKGCEHTLDFSLEIE